MTRDPVERPYCVVTDALDRKTSLAKAGQGCPRRMRQPAGRINQGVERCAPFLRQHLNDKRLLGSGARRRASRMPIPGVTLLCLFGIG